MFDLKWDVDWKLHSCFGRVCRRLYGNGYDGFGGRDRDGDVHCHITRRGYVCFDSSIRCCWDGCLSYWPELCWHNVQSIVFSLRPIHFIVMLDLRWGVVSRLPSSFRHVWQLYRDGYIERG
jgi:hypothetical protein